MTNRKKCRIRFCHLKRRKSKAQGGYKCRNKKLSNLGYESYKEYLDSEDWKAIRSRVLDANRNCCLCASPTKTVHHYCYLESVLLGLADEMLFPLCDNCHEAVEFNGEEKRSLEESQQALTDAFRSTGRGSVANKIESSYRHLCKVEKQAKMKIRKRRLDEIAAIRRWYVERNLKVPNRYLKAADRRKT